MKCTKLSKKQEQVKDLARRETEALTRRVTGLKIDTNLRAGGLQPAYGTPP